MKVLFEEDPELFIIELMRYEAAVTSATLLYKEDTAEVIDGKRVAFQAGTPYQVVLAAANRDPTVFEDPNKFDPSRPNLGDQLSWNGRLRDVEARNRTAAPRLCPGYCVSLKLGALLCAGFMGSLDTLLEAGKLERGSECSNFNSDCVGEWGAWSSCSASCGRGFKTRSFSVVKPGIGDGRQCLFADSEQETAACNVDVCPEPCDEMGTGSCVKWTWSAVLEKCPATVPLFSELFTRAATETLVRGRQLQLPPIAGGADLASRVTPPEHLLALLDPEVFDQFVIAVATAAGFAKVKVTVAGADQPIPAVTMSVPCIEGIPSCSPLVDVDLLNPSVPAAIGAAIGGAIGSLCGSFEFNKLAFIDDLNVPNRNRWELILNKPKYQTLKVSEALGHAMTTKADWLNQLFILSIPLNVRKLGSGVIDWQQIFFSRTREFVARCSRAFPGIQVHRNPSHPLGDCC